MPWEDPNSGFDGSTGGSSASKPGTDKIEKVVNTSGGSKNDGKITSTTGTGGQQGFVNDFLDKTGEKIKNAGGGSGWVWTWEKKWKVGPDGKPMEVKEDWQKGNIGVKTEPVPSPAPAAPTTPGSSGPSTPTTTAGKPATPAGGTSAAKPAAVTPGSSPTKPSTPTGKTTPTTTAKATPGTPGAGKPATPGAPSAPTTPATPATPGVDPAPPLLPPAEVRLVIQNPITFEEEPFSNNVYPTVKNPPMRAVRSRLQKAVPEDTRVRIGLELSEDINPQDVVLTITDSEGQQPPVSPDSYQNYRHMFRIPDDNRYFARVLYKHPQSTDPTPQEVIKVIIPVYKMGFDSRTIDANQGRAGSASERQAGATGATASTYSRGTGSTNASDYADSSQADLSDLYSDPKNPPQIAGVGDGAGYLGSGQGTTQGAAGQTDAGQAGPDGQTFTGQAGQNAQYGASGQGSEYADGARGSRGKDAWSSQAAGSQGGSQGDRMAAATSGRSGYGSSGGGSNSGSGGASSAFSGRGGHAGNVGSSGDSAGSSDGSSSASSDSYGNSGAAGGASDADGSAGAGSGEGSAQYAAQTDAQGTPGGVQGAQVQSGSVSDDQANNSAYLIGLSMRNEADQKIQSFNFTNDPYPTAQQVKKTSQVSFSVNATANVRRETVNIVVFDGQDKREIPLNSGGEAFVQVFAKPTAEAYVWIYGDTTTDKFSYKLSIPISE